MENKIEFYEKNLERINYWLQFAETKNAAAIAYDVAILAVIYTDKTPNIRLFILITVFSISIVFAFISLFPQYNKDVYCPEGIYNATDNLIFWNDIAKYSVNEYITEIDRRFFKEIVENETFVLEKSFAEEIITNARIARYKYEMLKKTVITSIIGTILIPILFLLEVL